ncbi:MAG: aminoacetone oxidase family FAD-binding enzyme [Clostridia bacterium]|nr:aminoacetone oxidase family FAD-binding enzyme [Clostridia bacterium]
MKYFDIAILGAGASGCMCALQTDERQSVVLIDKASYPAKKLMATGNGKCNLSNAQIEPNEEFYNHDLEGFFSRFDVPATLEYFSDNGLVFYNDEEGRIYPFSDSAKSVIDVICNALAKKKNVTLAMNEEILNVSKEDDVFIVKTSGETYCVKKLVCALGGKASESVIQSFNIKHRNFVPSLCALKTQNTKLLSGCKVSPVHIFAYSPNGNLYNQQFGELLFKDSGLSGICAFNLSSEFARRGCYEGKLVVDLVPEIEKEELIDVLMRRRELDLPISKFFEGFLANPIAYYILNKCKFNESASSTSLTEGQLEMMIDHMKALEFIVQGNYDNNQIYSGGVLLSALDDNLQAKELDNLYFCGEACDVDGICGGFNLQWAWTSGYIVGKSL